MGPGTVKLKVRIFVKFSGGCGVGKQGRGARAASGGQKLPQTTDKNRLATSDETE